MHSSTTILRMLCSERHNNEEVTCANRLSSRRAPRPSPRQDCLASPIRLPEAARHVGCLARSVRVGLAYDPAARCACIPRDSQP
jgi:hypothetical protein